MTSLSKPATLPLEILDLVVQHTTDNTTLLNLCLVSRQLNLLATPRLYNVIRIHSVKSFVKFMTHVKVNDPKKCIKHFDVRLDTYWWSDTSFVEYVEQALFSVTRQGWRNIETFHLVTSGPDSVQSLTTRPVKPQVSRYVARSLFDSVFAVYYALVPIDGPIHVRWRYYKPLTNRNRSYWDAVAAGQPTNHVMSIHHKQYVEAPLPKGLGRFAMGGLNTVSLETPQILPEAWYNTRSRVHFQFHDSGDKIEIITFDYDLRHHDWYEETFVTPTEELELPESRKLIYAIRLAKVNDIQFLTKYFSGKTANNIEYRIAEHSIDDPEEWRQHVVKMCWREERVEEEVENAEAQSEAEENE
ncbi:hypothetical protein CI109_106802 [Kwoniella shandongensis]|uniref:Uncharacterized protein n=1 Tax=Kwoniella shandongensis TaxID=1734106 RepID=A0A5M6C798_9TREE|nr:uncharacterized protein CI109_000941 [Kwoniella shandongensis]KAA5530761.1 hypothetical protein CI109_000941 [Kwoniella shandongensis]